jgi:peptidoglycan/xylan/chitin deacetylase (PgdA/CDA1 family)
MFSSKKWVALILVLFVAVLGVLFIVKKNADPSKKNIDQRKRAYILQSLKISQHLTKQGIELIKQRQVDKAIDSFNEAIRIFPPSNEAYQLLLKIYLMTGQEQKVYETLERAGRSYPTFDQILKVVNNEDLARIPMPDETADVFIAPFYENRKMAVSFMFDDGETSVYTGVMPIFDRFNYKATVSVVASQVMAKSGDPYRGSWAQWRDAADRGFEIANHSMHHLDAKKLKPDEYKTEIDDAKAMIEEKVGKPVYAYVFPLDSFSSPVLQHVLKSHSAVRDPAFLRSIYSRTVDIMYGGPNFSVDSANRLIDISRDRHLWLISECHGLDIKSKGSYKPLTEDFLKTHLSYIKSRDKDIWVDTFSSVFGYLMVRKMTQVMRKDIAAGEAEIILHNPVMGHASGLPMTVVLRVVSAGVKNAAATLSDGRAMKAWACADAQVCVDVTEYDQPVRVTWGL